MRLSSSGLAALLASTVIMEAKAGQLPCGPAASELGEAAKVLLRLFDRRAVSTTPPALVFLGTAAGKTRGRAELFVAVADGGGGEEETAEGADGSKGEEDVVGVVGPM